MRKKDLLRLKHIEFVLSRGHLCGVVEKAVECVAWRPGESYIQKLYYM